MIKRQEIYKIICIIKIIINSFVQIYQDKQIRIFIPQQISFTGKLEKDDGATMFFIAEKQQKTILNFSLHAII